MIGTEPKSYRAAEMDPKTKASVEPETARAAESSAGRAPTHGTAGSTPVLRADPTGVRIARRNTRPGVDPTDPHPWSRWLAGPPPP